MVGAAANAASIASLAVDLANADEEAAQRSEANAASMALAVDLANADEALRCSEAGRATEALRCSELTDRNRELAMQLHSSERLNSQLQQQLATQLQSSALLNSQLQQALARSEAEASVARLEAAARHAAVTTELNLSEASAEAQQSVHREERELALLEAAARHAAVAVELGETETAIRDQVTWSRQQALEAAMTRGLMQIELGATERSLAIAEEAQPARRRLRQEAAAARAAPDATGSVVAAVAPMRSSAAGVQAQAQAEQTTRRVDGVGRRVSTRLDGTTEEDSSTGPSGEPSGESYLVFQ